MKTQANECATLGEYRREVLKAPQSEIARYAKCHAAWLSQVERGHLPAPWRREVLLKAYKLESAPQEFERMVVNAAKLRAMRKPMRQTEPLLAMSGAPMVTVAEVVEAGDILKAATRVPALSNLAGAIGAEIYAQKARQA